MSESVRRPEIVAVEYGPFPLTRGRGDVGRQDTGASTGGPKRLWIARASLWSLASARQRLLYVLRPLAVAAVALDTVRRDAGAALWRWLYTAAAMMAGVFSISHDALAEGFWRFGRVWHDFRLVWSRRLYRRLTLVCLFSVVCVGSILSSFYTLGLEVVLDGESIGFVSSASEFDRAVDDVSARASEILRYTYVPTPDVTYRYRVIDRNSVFNREEVEDQLFAQVADIKKLDVLTVDGVTVAATADRVGLEAILNRMLQAYDMDGEAYATAFVQEVTVSTQWADTALERSAPEIGSLLSVASGARYDQVGETETLDQVAQRNGLSVETLSDLNGGVSPEELDASDKLLVHPSVPYLSVEARRRIQYEESIPYDSITVTDDTIYEGDTRTRVSGAPGVALVTADVIYLNGVENTRAETGRATVTEPVQEVIALGTKKRPPKAPTGVFMWPTHATLTSRFGTRWGRLHAGIDLAGPVGTSIVAADGGIVTFAGWRSGYGYCVIISHGSTLSTLYGHNSKLLVSEGQAVAKGELIAKMGSTGNSTGPHCHFEIRVNGTPVNPLKYLN
ncbi:MAG: peptidoglycan DD-metalloendopeptidase family protein [Oscillospiraceae bacterium]|jgi:murein DD-endopeptidase MepM/ murein hydrolase activator NlpD|nr:peptidoglycan DD-metalloendopeptidase family protein [Oscillospiraceae bacterium]